MSFTITTTNKAEDAARFLARSILSQLQAGKSVLFFVTGGSSIAVALKVAEILKSEDCSNLTITMTDERYGAPGHADSNWHQMMEKGFNLPNAKLIPILMGEDLASTVHTFNENLVYEFNVANYTIGLFGVGKDGHTAGILPDSPAVKSEDLAYGYGTPTFTRITITPEFIKQFDEAVVFMQGEEKWPVIKDLEKNLPIAKAPAQILKKVPLLNIFTDYKK